MYKINIYNYFHCFTSVSCSHGQVRLVAGSHQFEGRVEICINREWGSVCDNQWDKNDAKVVCRQLGYPESGEFIHSRNANHIDYGGRA